jgi:hypothetical protein
MDGHYKEALTIPRAILEQRGGNFSYSGLLKASYRLFESQRTRELLIPEPSTPQLQSPQLPLSRVELS